LGPVLDAQWLAALRARADVPPRRPRVPLWAGGEAIGTVEDRFISQIGLKSSSSIHSLLQKQEQTVGAAWVLSGDPTESMDGLAQALRAAGLAGAWRDEQLAVHGPRGRRIGTIERGAVRPLGIATHAVHLTGSTPDGRVWVQQRAWDKANDPGMWDTLMGGMVPASDTLAEALARETWEEAGLHIDALVDVTASGRLHFRRPSDDGGGAGYLVESIDWFSAKVPDGLLPVNQDGEVAQFALLTREEVAQRLAEGAFTLEAALILAAWLGVN
jgi:8-oxo-dGTP pyrophosphatase MutT (NUDIX family)